MARPPTHTVTDTRCAPRLSTAISWSAEPAAWPANASGRMASRLSAASQPMAFRLRAIAAPVATTKASNRLVTIARPRSKSCTKLDSWAPNPAVPSLTPAKSA